MTTFEKNQPNNVFIKAGRTAYTMGILPQNNPYKDKPFSIMWERGYQNEKRKQEQKRGGRAW